GRPDRIQGPTRAGCHRLARSLAFLVLLFLGSLGEQLGKGAGWRRFLTPSACRLACATGGCATCPAAARLLPWRVIQAHGKRDALAWQIHLHHLDLDDVAGLYHLARILDESMGKRRDMHQSILMHADIDEGAEVGD